jgi:protein phosphatase
VLLILALIGGAAYGAWRWSQTQYYVGAADSHVAIYRGLTQNVGPLDTSKVFRDEDDVRLADLPPYQREQVRADIATDGLADAERVVARLRDQAELCRAARSAPSSTPTPTASGSPAPAPSSPAPSPSPTPTPSPSPTPTGADTSDCESTS